ncbi:hypothetical protein B0H19DRAFT_1073129 [Mycena capillaripes]|nr:hypothetical protein B0H19DRAFT_1073129 [Mycena capillaripes]
MRALFQSSSVAYQGGLYSVNSHGHGPEKGQDCRGTVVQVNERDQKCRFTGVERNTGVGPEEEEEDEIGTATLHVVHCLPFATGSTSFVLLEALTGIQFTEWEADSVGNAFLARTGICELFESFRFFLEWTQTNEGAAGPKTVLRGMLDDAARQCTFILDTSLRPRHDTIIPDIESKYFIVHKFIGDIVWMSGGAEPFSDEEDENMMVTDSNIDALMERLLSPEMDMVPRERQGIYMTRFELVPKDMV